MSERTLQIRCEAIPTTLGTPVLSPVSLCGQEDMNQLFSYELVLRTPACLAHTQSDTTRLQRDTLIGKPISVLISLDHQEEVREINAIITQVTMRSEEDIQYVLTLQPWLSLAGLRSDIRIFQDKHVIEILDTVLAAYPFNIDKQLIDTYPVRDYQTQYNESDLAFMQRLCAEWGINYFFRHQDGQHTLVLTDHAGGHPTSAHHAYQQVRFSATTHQEDDECIRAFTCGEAISSGRYTARDYDYTRPHADLTMGATLQAETAHNAHEVYEWHQASHFVQPRAGAAQQTHDVASEGQFLAQRRMQAIHAKRYTAAGEGSLRGLMTGHVFKLQDHPAEHANQEWLITGASLSLEEIPHTTQLPGSARTFAIHSTFTALPATIVPRPDIVPVPPSSTGPHIAVVTGPADQSIWTDSLGRIKVQFPWDRHGQHDEQSGCWIRVASPWAGKEFGVMNLPRIGQEVLVDFIGGNPNLPICTGRLYNQAHMPPWQLPSQQALSGIRSRELSAGATSSSRSNHLVLDDTKNALQAQLYSDHLHSQLVIGHNTRITNTRGRQDTRGEGFELRSDGQGVLRAGQGMLVTTAPRPNAAGHMMSASESIGHIKLASTQQETQAKQAQHDEQGVIAGAFKKHAASIQAWEGKEAHKKDMPHLVLTSGADMSCTTQGDTYHAANTNMSLTTGQHMTQSVGKSWLVSIAERWSVFVERMDMVLRAAKGKVTIVSAENEMTLQALKDLHITSTGDSVIISAKKKVVINGAGSYTQWDASGITHGTSGAWTEHAASHSASTPKNQPLTFEKQSSRVCKECRQSSARAGSPMTEVR